MVSRAPNYAPSTIAACRELRDRPLIERGQKLMRARMRGAVMAGLVEVREEVRRTYSLTEAGRALASLENSDG